MERRKFLIASGALAAGGAATLGSGAFTTVEANRDVEIGVAGDASAFLALLPANDDPNVARNPSASKHENADEYVEYTNDTLYIDLSGTDAGGQGANKNADTKFANLFDIVNQGSQTVNVYVEDDPVDTEFGMFAEGQEDDGSAYPVDDDSDPQDASGFDVSDPVTLDPGSVVENVSIAWDGSPPSEDTYTITLVANRANQSQP